MMTLKPNHFDKYFDVISEKMAWLFFKIAEVKFLLYGGFHLHLLVQQGLEIRGFWFQKKTVQRKTVLHEVYTYV